MGELKTFFLRLTIMSAYCSRPYRRCGGQAIYTVLNARPIFIGYHLDIAFFHAFPMTNHALSVLLAVVNREPLTTALQSLCASNYFPQRQPVLRNLKMIHKQIRWSSLKVSCDRQNMKVILQVVALASFLCPVLVDGLTLATTSNKNSSALELPTEWDSIFILRFID